MSRKALYRVLQIHTRNVVQAATDKFTHALQLLSPHAITFAAGNLCHARNYVTQETANSQLLLRYYAKGRDFVTHEQVTFHKKKKINMLE